MKYMLQFREATHIQFEGGISVTNMCTPPPKSATRSLTVAGTPPLTSFRVMLELRVAVEPSRSPTRSCGGAWRSTSILEHADRCSIAIDHLHCVLLSKQLRFGNSFLIFACGIAKQAGPHTGRGRNKCNEHVTTPSQVGRNGPDGRRNASAHKL